MLEKLKLKFYPSKSEIRIVNKLIDEIKAKLNQFDVVLGGSVAKGTFMQGNHDIDFFVRFKNEEEMRNLYKKLKSKFRGVKKIRGSREYYEIKYKNYNVEFVPILRIERPDQARNITDVSPFHAEFVNSNLNEEQKKDVVLLKQFCKSAGIYGAETHTMGLSGYVIELLVAYYLSFTEVLEKISSTAPPIIISFSDSEASNISSLTIIDPVQPDRNTAAAVSGKSLATLQMKAKMFLRDYKKGNVSKYFVHPKSELETLKKTSKKRGTRLVVKKLKISEDRKKFLGSLSRKIKRIALAVKSEGFTLYDFGIIEAEKYATIYFEFETLKVSKYKRHYGPPPHVDDDYFDNFIKKWKNSYIYIHNGRLCVDVERDYADTKQLLRKLFRKFDISS